MTYDEFVDNIRISTVYDMVKSLLLNGASVQVIYSSFVSQYPNIGELIHQAQQDLSQQDNQTNPPSL